jgi:4-diphosphocytidyl-2-C-methyl-D-erythritol kinase
VETTLRRLRELDAGLQLGAITLTKNLPVAAGLGGGSADAAAVLRAVRSPTPIPPTASPGDDIAARLGADVPVCLVASPP